MKTAMQMYGLALALATSKGVRYVGQRPVIALSEKEVMGLFASNGFNVVSSKAWKGQKDCWLELELTGTTKDYILFIRPPTELVSIASGPIRNAEEMAHDFAEESGRQVLGWEYREGVVA